jgi:hypothetical protein
MNTFTVTAISATGFTALALGLTALALATGVGTETVTGGQAIQLPHLCGSGPLSPVGHPTLTCLPRLALTPVTLT